MSVILFVHLSQPPSQFEYYVKVALIKYLSNQPFIISLLTAELC